MDSYAGFAGISSLGSSHPYSGGGQRRGLSAPPVGLLDASISTMPNRKAIAYPGLNALTMGSVGSSMNEQRRAGGRGQR